MKIIFLIFINKLIWIIKRAKKITLGNKSANNKVEIKTNNLIYLLDITNTTMLIGAKAKQKCDGSVNGKTVKL